MNQQDYFIFKTLFLKDYFIHSVVYAIAQQEHLLENSSTTNEKNGLSPEKIKYYFEYVRSKVKDPAFFSKYEKFLEDFSENEKNEIIEYLEENWTDLLEKKKASVSMSIYSEIRELTLEAMDKESNEISHT